ncbi:hypothetical protein QAD02_021851 [Eretmocerus hayati]|uniref:Uncharacterized protein n=1 Tax=Eretmocerus hayati TaxID=131215 RepID=A0ACC2PSG9_9HYME|nr:hypothetical protein QAD02_021851 [Eretmocerus hayati]
MRGDSQALGYEKISISGPLSGCPYRVLDIPCSQSATCQRGNDTNQSFLAVSQSDASVSVVRLSQTCDIEEAGMTLTVDPPDNLPLGVNLHDARRGPSQLSERSHRSDPERLKQMGTASTFGDTLKNLGKNITAMLGKYYDLPYHLVYRIHSAHVSVLRPCRSSSSVSSEHCSLEDEA